MRKRIKRRKIRLTDQLLLLDQPSCLLQIAANAIYAFNVRELSFLADLSFHLRLLLIVSLATISFLVISVMLLVTKSVINYLFKTFGEYWTVKLIWAMHEILVILLSFVLCLTVLRKLFDNLL